MKNDLCLCVAVFACHIGASFAATAAADYSRPVATPKGVCWNRQSVMFMYPPAFDFKVIDRALRYRYVIEDDDHRLTVFEASTPCESLAPVWRQLPTGFLRLEVRGVDESGRTLGFAGVRRFWKSAPFRESICPEPAWSYREAVDKYYDWLLKMKNTRALLETGEPDQYYVYNTYPAKTDTALINAFVHLASWRPQIREKAMTLACRAADHMLACSNAKGSPLEYFPHTYRVLAPESSQKGVQSKNYEGQNMLLYPAEAGLAYLRLYRAGAGDRYLHAALNIADTYCRHQGDDGTWPLKVWEKGGEPVTPNRLFPIIVCRLLDELYCEVHDARYQKASARAFSYVENGPLKTWNWEGQFEDVKPSEPYLNLQIHTPCDVALYLLKKHPGDREKLALARECARFAEDQFVAWEPPFTEDGRGPMTGETTMFPKAEKKLWYDLPGAFEQYDWYLPIDGSAAKCIELFLALYRVEGDPVDLAKARAFGNAITQAQKLCGGGAIPTHWVPWDVKSDARHWINCGIYSVSVLADLMNPEKR